MLFPAIFLFLLVLVLLDLRLRSCVATRWILEQNKQLEPRRSALEDDFEEEEEKDEDEPLATGLDDEHEKVDFGRA